MDANRLAHGPWMRLMLRSDAFSHRFSSLLSLPFIPFPVINQARERPLLAPSLPRPLKPSSGEGDDEEAGGNSLSRPNTTVADREKGGGGGFGMAGDPARCGRSVGRSCSVSPASASAPLPPLSLSPLRSRPINQTRPRSLTRLKDRRTMMVTRT